MEKHLKCGIDKKLRIIGDVEKSIKGLE